MDPSRRDAGTRRDPKEFAMRLPRLLSTLLSVATALFAGSASAAVDEPLGPIMSPGELQAGGLLLGGPGGLRAAPTISTEVEIQVTGLIARTHVVQRFLNPTTDWLEGVYVFPLPEKAAVDALHMRVGERILEGHVQERVAARASYEKAQREGRKASLVEQERPNVFMTSVANLGPGEEIEVRIAYQEDVAYDQGRFSLRFPMVVAPRFIPGARAVTGFAGTGWGSNTDQVPDAARITPPIAPPKVRHDHPVTIRARIEAGFRLAEVESASHSIRVRAEHGDTYAVELDGGPVQADSDFVLGWQPVVGRAPAAALFREQWKGEQYALLMVLPPEPENARQTRLSRETILVVDTSGSMGGESIEQARGAVSEALSRLRPEDAFNVIRFDSSFSRLFPDSRPADAEALEIARRWVGRLRAQGGTEMLPALGAALAP
ncbi:MAG: marine proteobacterial sortase target protein, partial [Deltaproteobacteria bacterium]|nr:marine proteobacterial sortase target protein [Deltaproteobacteria bacterium]